MMTAESEKETTSIRVDKEVWKEAKHYAIEKGITLTELVENALKREMRSK